jgi:two-component system response regulator PilR (NtrC family)
MDGSMDAGTRRAAARTEEELWSSTRALESALEAAAEAEGLAPSESRAEYAARMAMHGRTRSEAVAVERPDSAAVASGLVMAPGSPLAEAVRLAAAAAGRDCPVYLRGESGSGKELLARFLHGKSARRAGPWVAVNCGALSPQLLESELFGHRKGAFTGANEDRPGRFRAAAGGTLFLDEVGELPPEAQTKLLRALQEKTVSPVGDSREYPVDFRLVCATHKDLAREVREGRFREDLYYRMAVMEITVPALRERPGDLVPLLRRFLEKELGASETRAALASLPPEILRWPFPGNVRELRNLAERYAVMRALGGGWIEAFRAMADAADRTAPRGPGTERVSQALPEAPPRSPIRNSRVTDAEIMQALEECGWHRTRTSERLGMTRRGLQYRLARMAPETRGIDAGEG